MVETHPTHLTDMNIDKNGNTINVTPGMAGFQPTVNSEATTDPNLNAMAANMPDMVSLDDKGFEIAFGTLSVAEDHLYALADSFEDEGDGASASDIENDLHHLEAFRNVLRAHQHEHASATPNSMPPVSLTVDHTGIAFEACALAEDYFEAWASDVEDEGDAEQLAEIETELRNVETFREALRRRAPAEPVSATIPSKLPASSPFTRCNTIEELEMQYEAVTSPENISWDGERSGADVQKAATQFYKDASVRQRELREAGVERD